MQLFSKLQLDKNVSIYVFSGGYAVGLCPHGIVYCLKHVLRAEGARDYGDLLLSLECKPTIVIIDFAHVLAKHLNKRRPNYFQPNEGRVTESTQENIDAAQNKTLQPIDIDFNDDNITLCLYDKFHESNTRKPEEILRRTKFVNNFKINTQIQEQFFAQQTRNNYFLIYMTMTKHLFLMRVVFDDNNNSICLKHVQEIQKRLKKEPYLDRNGILTIHDDKFNENTMPNIATKAHKTRSTDTTHKSKTDSKCATEPTDSTTRSKPNFQKTKETKYEDENKKQNQFQKRQDHSISVEQLNVLIFELDNQSTFQTLKGKQKHQVGEIVRFHFKSFDSLDIPEKHNVIKNTKYAIDVLG